MIGDATVAALLAYLAAGVPEGLTYYERDQGADLTYPAVVGVESGTEEHEILRGVWNVTVLVELRTRPEDDEGAVAHRAFTDSFDDVLGNVPALKDSFLSAGVRCWDVWGGSMGMTDSDDGFRLTTFTMELTVSYQTT